MPCTATTLTRYLAGPRRAGEGGSGMINRVLANPDSLVAACTVVGDESLRSLREPYFSYVDQLQVAHPSCGPPTRICQNSKPFHRGECQAMQLVCTGAGIGNWRTAGVGIRKYTYPRDHGTGRHKKKKRRQSSNLAQSRSVQRPGKPYHGHFHFHLHTAALPVPRCLDCGRDDTHGRNGRKPCCPHGYCETCARESCKFDEPAPRVRLAR